MKFPLDRPPTWLPWLGPILAAVTGAMAGRFWLDGSRWTVLIAALVCGFMPIAVNAAWKWWLTRR